MASTNFVRNVKCEKSDFMLKTEFSGSRIQEARFPEESGPVWTF